MNEEPSPVLRILLHAVIEPPVPFEELQDALLQLAGTLARDDLHQADPLFGRLPHYIVQRAFNIAALIEYVVQIERQLAHGLSIIRESAVVSWKRFEEI